MVVLVVNLVVSSSVIEQKMVDKALESIGYGCNEMYQRVQASSFSSLKDTEIFSFENMFECLRL